MKNYILVHGAWGGAWEFNKVVKLLSADGSNVIAVDLPGHGENQAPIAEVTLDAYVQHVIKVINDVNEPVILVGHSLAGFIVSQVAESIPQQIERLIYVAAFLPNSGESPIELMQNDEGSQLIPTLIFSEDQSYATMTGADITRVLLHDVEDEQELAKMVSGLQTQQAVEPFMATASLSATRFGTVPKFYVRATIDKVMSLPLQNAMIGNWDVEQVFTLESGHFPLSSIPEQLVDALNQASEETVTVNKQAA